MSKIGAILLSPLSVIYYLITSLRNKLFDWGVLKTISPSQFTISVGNLSVGGSGKTPFIKYLIRAFNDKNIAVLSRGYGRNTKGFLEVTSNTSSMEVGDEPKMLSNEKAKVYVCENRVKGAKLIHKIQPNSNMLLLDDAFQHRYIGRDINIMINDFNFPFYKDFIMPSGRLREKRSGATRADVIIISKVPTGLKGSDLQPIKQVLRRFIKPGAEVFFCNYTNSEPLNFRKNNLATRQKVRIVSALANNFGFENYVKSKYIIESKRYFSDHHNYTEKNVKEIFENLNNSKIVTTAKDYIKLKDICTPDQLEHIFWTDTDVKFVEGEEKFKSIVLNALKAHR